MSVTMRRLVERAKITVGTPPHAHIGYVESLDKVWVLNAESITILDGATGRPEGETRLGGRPAHVIYDEAAGRGYIPVGDELVVLDLAGTVQKRIPLPSGEASVLLPMQPNRRMYVLSKAGGALDVLDTATDTVVKSIPTGKGSAWGQPHENTIGKLYIVNADSDDVTIIDEPTETVLATVKVGRRPHRNGIFRERGLVYSANYEDGTVSAVSIADDAFVATVAVGEHPFRLVAAEKKVGRPELWVLNRGSEAKPAGVICIVNAVEQRVTSTVEIMDRPSNWLFKGATLHVVGAHSRDLLVVDAHTTQTVGSGRLSEDPDPTSHSNMVFNSAKDLFVANAGDTISIFSAPS